MRNRSHIGTPENELSSVLSYLLPSTNVTRAIRFVSPPPHHPGNESRSRSLASQVLAIPNFVERDKTPIRLPGSRSAAANRTPQASVSAMTPAEYLPQLVLHSGNEGVNDTWMSGSLVEALFFLTVASVKASR